MDKATGLRFDQTVVTTGLDAQYDYPDPLRRIGYRDPKTGKMLAFLTNTFTVPALWDCSLPTLRVWVATPSRGWSMMERSAASGHREW